jgi:hypothetical protein
VADEQADPLDVQRYTIGVKRRVPSFFGGTAKLITASGRICRRLWATPQAAGYFDFVLNPQDKRRFSAHRRWERTRRHSYC